MTVQERVRDFILVDLAWGGPRELLTDDSELIASGIVDSMAIYELVRLLEEEYGLVIEDNEVLPENLGTATAVARFVALKRGS